MAYDRLKDTVAVLNYAITKNRMSLPNTVVTGTDEGGDATTTTTYLLAEDLSNLSDVGVAVASMDADALKSFQKDVAMGLAKIEFIDRVYKADTFGIAKTGEEYDGAYQRICLNSLPEVQNSNASNLVSGVDYFDGKYYGMDLNAKVFSDVNVNCKIPWSIGEVDIKQKFVDKEWVVTTISEWRNAVATSLEIKLKGVADDLVNRLIKECYTDKRIQLVTGFNSYMGYTGADAKTWADIKQSETLARQFKGFWSLVVGLVKGGFNRLSKKYNDGSVPTFTPSDKISLIGLTQFINALDTFADPTSFNVIPRENIYTTVAWQSTGSALTPFGSFDITTDICDKIRDGAITITEDGVVEDEDATTYSNVVAVMYDSDMMGVTPHVDRIGVQEIGSELYTTYFHHVSLSNYLDLRGNAVVFTLD